jgi:tetratricopeptide (TPR) repeat protein
MPWNLSVAYGRNPQSIKDSGALLWTWIIPVTAALVIFAQRKNRPWLFAGVLFTVLAPLPVLGWIRFDFQRISTVSDHYLYLAMFGPALVVSAVIASFFPSRFTQGEGQGEGSLRDVRGQRLEVTNTRPLPGTLAALSLPLALLVFLAADSFIQLSYWQDNLTIWQHAVAVSPDCPEVHENLGFAYADLGQKYAKEQAREFAIAVKLKPDNMRDHDLLSGALISTGQIDAAIAQMKIAMRLEEAHDRPGTTLPGERLAAYRSLGDLLLAKNRPDEAAQMFRKILKQLPNDPTARTHLEFCIYRLPKQIDAKPILLGSSQF